METSETSGSVSREVSPDRPIAQPPRRRAACESCHSSKVKCTGGQPCARCKTGSSTCIYKLASRIGKPKGSKNKSTLRRLQLEAERAAQKEAEKSSHSPHTPLSVTEVSASGSLLYSQSHSMGYGYEEPGIQDFPLPGHSWDWDLNPNNWLGGLEIPFGSPASYGPALSPGEGGWMSEAYLGDPNYLASRNIQAPPNDPTLDGTNMGVFDETCKLKINTGNEVYNHMASLSSQSFTPEISDFTSILTASQSAPPRLTEGNYFPQISSSTPAFWKTSKNFMTTSSCSCAVNLASGLYRFRHPETPTSTTHRTDLFLTNSEQLLQVLNVFLGCITCEKNPMVFSLMMTVFASLMQIMASVFSSYNMSEVHDSHPNRPRFEADLSNSIDREISMRAMALHQAAQNWRGACSEALQLLEKQKKEIKEPNFGFHGSPTDLVSGGGGSKVWALEDLEACAMRLGRFDSELAMLT